MTSNADCDAGRLEVQALARRAREASNFYAYTGSASHALRSLADDLDALAARMGTRDTAPGDSNG